MKLVYQGHSPVELLPGRLTILQVGNPVVNVDLIQGLQGRGEKVQILDDDLNEAGKQLAWDGDLILSPERLQKYQSLLEKTLLHSLAIEYRQSLNDQARKMFTAIQKSLFEVDLPLEVTFDEDLHRLVKYARLHYSSSAMTNPYGIIGTDVKMHLELGDCRVVGLCNVFNYLDSTDDEALAKLVEGSQLSILIIQFSESQNWSVYKNADVYGIDKDFIDWH